MRVVAVRADHYRGPNTLIRANRVCGQLQAIGALPLVTVEAHFSLGSMQFHRVVSRVQAVAADTSGVIALVHAACPGKTDIIVVTTHADSVLVRHWGRRIVTKINDGTVHVGGFAASGVRAARPVAGLTLQLRHGCFGICLLAVRRAKYHQHVVRVVAAQAGIRTGSTVFGLRRFNVLAAHRPRDENQQQRQ